MLQTSWGSDSTRVKGETQGPLVAAIFTRTMASKSFWKLVSSCLAFHRIFAFAFCFQEVSHSLNSITQWTVWEYLHFTHRKTQVQVIQPLEWCSLKQSDKWRELGETNRKQNKQTNKNRTSKSKHSCNSRNLWNRTDVEQPDTLLTHGVRQRPYKSSWAWRLHKQP